MNFPINHRERDPAREASNRDSLNHLVRHGFGRLLNAVNDPANSRGTGRLILHKIAKTMGTNKQDVKQQLANARNLLD